MAVKSVTIKLVKSPAGRLKKQKACVAGLGLRRIGDEVVVEDVGIKGEIEILAEADGKVEAIKGEIKYERHAEAVEDGENGEHDNAAGAPPNRLALDSIARSISSDTCELSELKTPPISISLCTSSRACGPSRVLKVFAVVGAEDERPPQGSRVASTHGSRSGSTSASTSAGGSRNELYAAAYFSGRHGSPSTPCTQST